MTQDPSASLVPGNNIGDWTLVRKLGEGAMGMVFEARSRTNVTVALKVIRPQLLVHADAAQRFRREGRILQKINHPNVVKIVDLGESQGFPFIALGFIDGPSLEDRLPIEGEERRRLAIDLLRGLSAIHDAGILHRDLKPGNIMLGKDGSWKITDFGLARRENEESIVVTRPGALLGTPHYMSPEQCRGEAVEVRSDLYSAGALLYNAYAGVPPFMGKAVMDVIRSHLETPPADLGSRVTGLSKDLADLVTKLLAKQRAGRPENARAALALIGSNADVSAAVIAAPVAIDSRPIAASVADASGPARPLAQTIVDIDKKGGEPRPHERTPGAMPRGVPQDPAAARAAARGAVRPSGMAQALPGAATTTPETRAAGTGTGNKNRLALTKSGRVPGIIKHDAPKRGTRIPWERATVPLLPAGLALLVYAVTHVGGRDAFFDEYVGVPYTEYFGMRFLRMAAVVGGTIGVLRILTGFFEVNAPPSAKAKSWHARMRARMRARLLRGSPKLCANALRDLGEFAEAAEVLAAGGFLKEAGAEYLRANEVAKAAKIFEKLNDADAAVKAYVKLGDTRAADVALKAGRFEDAAILFSKHGDHAQAADAFQKAGKPIEAANAFEAASRPEEAGLELLRALENGQGPLANLPFEDRHKYAVRSADLLVRAGAALEAAQRFEKLAERELAQQLFEHGGDFAEAARIATTRGDHEIAAELYTKAGRTLAAAKARGEALMVRRKRSGLTQGGAVNYEDKESLSNAAACFEAAGEPARAADLFAHSGDLASAARLYEKAGAWREAALCHRERGDVASAARVLQQADPIAAAEALAANGQNREALEILANVSQSSPRRGRAVALLGDVHKNAGNESEAIAAFAAALDDTTRSDPDLGQVEHCLDALAGMGRLDTAIDQLLRVRKRLGEIPELERMMQDLNTRKKTATGGPELVGCVVDRYRAVNMLGEGGTAWVYTAEHTFLGRTVALKIMKPNPAGGGDLSNRFYGEAQAVASLRHPNVIHVYDVGATPGGLLYMALELVKGEGLRKRLERLTRVPVPQACQIMSGVLQGLAVAHARGIVHRDMKPENVLLGANDQAKVVDFGIAKVVAQSPMTMTGTFLGTPKYASPEQAQGTEATYLSDIYACGLVLYELLSGKCPFESETQLGFLTKHATALPDQLENVARDIPRPLAQAVMRSLEKDPLKRWPDAEAFQKAIAPYVHLQGNFAPSGETIQMPLGQQSLRHAATMLDVDEAAAEETRAREPRKGTS
jgi:serine/threonine protein kinase/tetratricopeptide (TPR) repeat protein